LEASLHEPQYNLEHGFVIDKQQQQQQQQQRTGELPVVFS